MSKDEQKTLLAELSESILNEMCYQIDAGKVPEEWNGIELRQWFAETASAEATMRQTKDQRARWKAYKNTVIVNNL